MARENAQLNQLANLEILRENVFSYLKAAVAVGRRFETIVLDPPAFAKSRIDKAAAAARRQAKLIERRGAARDHPALLSLPESQYLKCLILEVE